MDIVACSACGSATRASNDATTYRYKDQLDTVRMQRDAGKADGRLPVKDGAVIVDDEG